LYLFQELGKESRSLVSELNTRSLLKDLRDIGISMTACCRKLYTYIVSHNFFIYL